MFFVVASRFILTVAALAYGGQALIVFTLIYFAFARGEFIGNLVKLISYRFGGCVRSPGSSTSRWKKFFSTMTEPASAACYCNPSNWNLHATQTRASLACTNIASVRTDLGSATMKAALTTAYGGPEVIRLGQAPQPVPNNGEVLVRVHAAAVTAADVRLRSAVAPRGYGSLMRAMVGFRRPRSPVMGMAFAGTIEALGAGVTEFSSGAAVFGSTEMKGGAHAEYLVVRADSAILPIPGGLSMAEAAGFSFGGLTAMDFLIDKGALASGERLLINGATGSVGTAAIQIARHVGAHVTAVCSGNTADLARDMGCDVVIDYHDGSIAGSYDVILDVVGTLPYARSRSLLAEGGRLLPVTASLAATLGAALRPRRGSHRITGSFTAADRAARSRLIALYLARAYRPVIGRTLPFDQIVEAHRLASAGGNRGNIVVVMVLEVGAAAEQHPRPAGVAGLATC